MVSMDLRKSATVRASWGIPNAFRFSWPLCRAWENVSNCCWNWGEEASSRTADSCLCSSGRYSASLSWISLFLSNGTMVSGLSTSDREGPWTAAGNCPPTLDAADRRAAARASWLTPPPKSARGCVVSSAAPVSSSTSAAEASAPPAPSPWVAVSMGVAAPSSPPFPSPPSLLSPPCCSFLSPPEGVAFPSPPPEPSPSFFSSAPLPLPLSSSLVGSEVLPFRLKFTFFTKFSSPSSEGSSWNQK
mmetsp:Transcript_5154/g.15489  ORF Transcript_5154/g.15489 Transcript_5154/m.15489 type:complete len:245 (-) Transcript_5154:702-1436(-)